MKKFDINKIMMILVLFLAIIEITIGKYIFAGIFLILAFSIYRNGGAGKYQDKTMYEKETDAENLTIESLYDALKDMNTPIGRCWIGKHDKYEGDVIVWGPNGFKDCITLGINKGKTYMRVVTNMDHFTYDDDQKWRFDEIIDTEDFDVTPKSFSFFTGYKLMTTMLLEDIRVVVDDLNNGIDRVPEELDMFNLYHYNSFDGNMFDKDGNLILSADMNQGDSLVKLSDVDGNEMIRIEKTGTRGEYRIIVDEEEYGMIRKERSKNDRYVLETEGGTFEANNFPAVNIAKISSNYAITCGSEVKAYTAVSAKTIFDGIGATSNAVICSMDDDYVVLYTAFQLLLINLYSWLR